jgi:hypothetical protein
VFSRRLRNALRRLALALIPRAAPLAFALAERSRVADEWLLRPLTRAFVRDAVSAWKRGGVAAWERFHLPFVRAVGAARAPHLARRLAIDAGSARSLGSVHDYEDPLLGIEGRWAEESRARAVRHETLCPIGDFLRQESCPDFCRVLVHAFEEATLRSLNPDYTLEPLTELRSAGADRCVFVHRVDQSRPTL